MSLDTKRLIEALYKDRHVLEGLIIMAFAPDGTTVVDIAGLPKENGRLFLHALAVLCSNACGMQIQPVARVPDAGTARAIEELPPEPGSSGLIIVPGKGDA